MSTATDELFEILNSETGLRRSGDRMYGGIGFTPNSNLGITVKKKTVEIYFETYGGEKDLSPVELMDWANKSELLRQEIHPGVFFELKQGARNKNKAALTAAIPYASEEELSSLAGQITEIVGMLAEKVDGFVTRKKSTNNQLASQEAAPAGDNEATAKYVFVVELHLDVEECDDDSDNPSFTNPFFELTEAFTATVEDEFECFAPGNLFEDGKPRLLHTPADLWNHVFYAKEDGLIDEIRPQIVILLSACDHWDYNFIKASQYAEIPGFTVFGHYPNVAEIGRQGYCGDDLDTGVYLAETEGNDTDGYTGADSIKYNGIGMSVFDLQPYLDVIADTVGNE